MRRFIPLLLLAALSASASQGWTQFSDRDGVVTSYKPIEGTKVLAMKGVGEVDVPLERVLGVFLDGSKSTEWVDLMIAYKEKPESQDVRVEYQLYDMPWPIWDREFVLRRVDTYDAATKTVRVTYTSVDDPAFPLRDDTVRGTDHGSFWEFTALPGGRTRIVIEVFIDPMGSIPSWLVNSIQRAWPHDSIFALVDRAIKPDIKPYPRVHGW
jgi:hypothetical protein